MRTLTVVAKFPQDGLYYLGKIIKEGDPVTILFPYNNGLRGSEVKELIPRSDVVTYAGSAPWPKLEKGDHVLTKVACDGMAHISYFPGKITDVPNAKFKNVYSVKLYTGTTVRKKRRDIIRVNGGQFQRLTEELGQKHHHKPDPPKPQPQIPVQDLVNLHPSKGDEVLVRWQDDGWYYYGIIVNMPKSGSKGVNRQYGVMDSTGQIEKIEEKYVLTDKMRDHSMKDIQMNSCVIAEHPDFPHSFAPGKIVLISRPHTATVEFYDGATKVINLPYIYLSTKLQHAEDINYIKRRSRREKVRVIARMDDTGLYHKGSIIVAEDEKHLVTIKFDTLGEEIIQSVCHVLTNTLLITPANNRQMKHYQYVLAPMEKDPFSYLPAKVEAYNIQDQLTLKLCNKTKSVCEPSKCYYISQDYYFNAFQYYYNRKAKQQHDHVRQTLKDRNKNNNKTDVRKIRVHSEPRGQIKKDTKHSSPTIEKGEITEIAPLTKSSPDGNKQGLSRYRQAVLTPQSDRTVLNQQQHLVNRPKSYNTRNGNRQNGSSINSKDIIHVQGFRRQKSTPRRWISPDFRVESFRKSQRKSRNSEALRDHVTYTTTVIRIAENERV